MPPPLPPLGAPPLGPPPAGAPPELTPPPPPLELAPLSDAEHANTTAKTDTTGTKMRSWSDMGFLAGLWRVP
jgi:hypothetical protein